jgi:hypothetical protein
LIGKSRWHSYIQLLTFLKDRRGDVKTLVALRPKKALYLYDIPARDSFALSLIQRELANDSRTQVIGLQGYNHLLGSVRAPSESHLNRV